MLDLHRFIAQLSERTAGASPLETSACDLRAVCEQHEDIGTHTCRGDPGKTGRLSGHAVAGPAFARGQAGSCSSGNLDQLRLAVVCCWMFRHNAAVIEIVLQAGKVFGEQPRRVSPSAVFHPARHAHIANPQADLQEVFPLQSVFWPCRNERV